MPSSSSAIEKQISEFVERFEPKAAKTIRQCRKELRKLLPTATELVYDNYNFFVIGYCCSAKPSTCILSLAAAANGVGLSFYHGASLQDPERLLQGAGKQNRFIRLPSMETLRAPGVQALIRQAVEGARVPLPKTGRGTTIIQSVSAKRRPRRKESSDI